MNIPTDFPPMVFPPSWTKRERDICIERLCIWSDGGPITQEMIDDAYKAANEERDAKLFPE